MIQIATQNRYPEFIPNQILTNVQLNQLHTYLDEQNRLTRTHLVGMGIICGLQVQVVDEGGNDRSIKISRGYGVTSEGYMIEIPQPYETKSYNLPGITAPLVDIDPEAIIDEVVLTNVRNYVDPYQKLNEDENPVPEYKPWLDDPNDGKDPSHLLDTQIPILELLTEDQLNHQLFVEQTGNVSETLNSGHLTNKVLVLYLETYPKDLKSCLTTDCTQNGLDKLLTVRALLIDKDCLEQIEPCTGLEELIDIPRLHHGLLQTNSSINTLDTSADLNDAYKDMAGYIRARITTLLPNSFAACEGFLNIHDLTNDIANLENFLLGTEVADEFTQYHFDYYKDLATAYNEFTKHICSLIKDCCIEGNFPKHLMLGCVDQALFSVNDSYRHHFMPSPARNVLREDLQKAEKLLRRIFALAQNFTLPETEIPHIRITPSQSEQYPLGERAMPYYYGPSEVENNWQPQNCCSSPVLSYAFNDMTNPATIDYTAIAAQPLLGDIHQHSFLRIEGHYGKACNQVVNQLNLLKSTHNLSFDICVLQFGDNSRLEIRQTTLQDEINEELTDIANIWNDLFDKAKEGPIDPVDLEKSQDEINNKQDKIKFSTREWQGLQTTKHIFCDISHLQADYLKLRAELFCKLRQLRPLLGELPEITESREACIDFGSFPRGQQFGTADDGTILHQPGTLIFTTNDIPVIIDNFFLSQSNFKFSRGLINESDGQSYLLMNLINLFFDLSNIDIDVNEVEIDVEDFNSRARKNISVNGERVVIFQDFLSLNGESIGEGVTYNFVPREPNGNNIPGTITLRGNIKRFRIGGEELRLNFICAKNSGRTRQQIANPQIDIRALKLLNLTNFFPQVFPKDICQVNPSLLSSLYHDIVDTVIQIKLLHCLVFSEGTRIVYPYSNFPKWDDLLYTLNELHYNCLLPQFMTLLYALAPLKNPRFRDVDHRLRGIEHQAGVSCGGTFVVVCEDIEGSDVEGMEVVADFTLCEDKCCCKVNVDDICFPPVALPDYEVITVEIVNGEPDPNQESAFIALPINDFSLDNSQNLNVKLINFTSDLGASLKLNEADGVVEYRFIGAIDAFNQIDKFEYSVIHNECSIETTGRVWILLTDDSSQFIPQDRAPEPNPNPGVRIVGNPIIGRVVFQGNEPAVGVTVLVQGTTQGAFTDVDGSFNLRVPRDGDYTLRFSIVGSLSQDIPISVQSNSTNQLGIIELRSLGLFSGSNVIIGAVGSSTPKLPGAENLFNLSVTTAKELSISTDNALMKVGEAFSQRHLERVKILNESREKTEVKRKSALKATEAFITKTLVELEISNEKLAKTYEEVADNILGTYGSGNKKEKDALKPLLEIITHAYMDRKALDNEEELDKFTRKALQTIAAKTEKRAISTKGIKDRWKGNVLQKELKIPLANDIKNSFK